MSACESISVQADPASHLMRTGTVGQRVVDYGRACATICLPGGTENNDRGHLLDTRYRLESIFPSIPRGGIFFSPAPICASRDWIGERLSTKVGVGFFFSLSLSTCSHAH